MQRHALLRILALALWALLAVPAVSVARDPVVDSPPPPGAVCPAISEDYELCRADPMSGNCRDFVTAAHALSRLYLFNAQREPQRAVELETTVWWGCGSATFAELAALLAKIDSPEARAVLAQSPYRSLPGHSLPGSPAAGRAPARQERRGASAPDCSAIVAPAELSACEKRSLAEAETAYRREVDRCKALLTPFFREQLAAAEAAWHRNLGIECPSGDAGTRCLATATRERTAGIARSHPDCGVARVAQAPAVRESPLKGGPRTGMLPARWTPSAGEAREVPFTFESSGRDTVQGTMHTTLGKGGERFAGSYLRIEKSTKGELVTAMSVDWSSPEWQLWKHDADGGWTQEGVSVGEFAHFYTGKVVATLRGDRGHAIRCQLVLKDPEAGLLEGGTGRCQVSDGGTLALGF